MLQYINTEINEEDPAYSESSKYGIVMTQYIGDK